VSRPQPDPHRAHQPLRGESQESADDEDEKVFHASPRSRASSRLCVSACTLRNCAISWVRRSACAHACAFERVSASNTLSPMSLLIRELSASPSGACLPVFHFWMTRGSRPSTDIQFPCELGFEDALQFAQDWCEPLTISS